MMSDLSPAATRSGAALGVLIACACGIALITFGMRSIFGLFTAPVSASHLWDREVFALAIALQNLVWGLTQPFAGAMVDRFGAPRVLAVGGALYGLGVAAMACADSPLGLQLSAGVLVGLGMGGASYVTVLGALGHLVPPARRSWALGVTTAAGSLGQFLFAPLGQAFIDGYGWKMAALLLACGVALVPLLAGGLRGAAAGAAGEGGSTPGFAAALRLAFGHAGYRLLVIGFSVCGFQLAFVTVHLPAYLGDLGLGGNLAAWALGLIGLTNVAGAYAAGVGGGRWSKPGLLTGIYLGRAAAIAALLLLPPSPALVLGFAAAIGLLWLSTVPLTSGLVAAMFGTRYFATLFGIVFFSHQVGSSLGVWLGGWVYTETGSYQLVWWLSLALSLIAAVLHWPISERPAVASAVERA